MPENQNAQYKELKDEELINLVNQGNKGALNTLIDRYYNLVNVKVSKYYINGAEKDDLIQEGLIGLFKSIKSYNPEKQNSFKTFANLCVERQLITAIKGSNRQKNLPLNSYISLNNTAYDNEEGETESQLTDMIGNSDLEDPLEKVTKDEYYKDVKETIDASLSPFEKQVLNEFVQGKTYNQIAKNLNAEVKSVDNAIQRIRKKTAKNIENLS